jgi:hypothetical protein
VDGGVPHEGVSDASAPADAGPLDDAGATSPDATAGGDASSDAVLVQLGMPTFYPNPNQTSISGPTPVTILPPSGFPPSGTILYTTDPSKSANPDTVYASPITVGCALDECGACVPPTYPDEIWAVATAPGYLASPVAYGTWSGEGSLVPPTFLPTSMTADNDITVTLTTPCGATTICYTLDGSTPTCSNGVCVGISLTYDAAAKIPIDGSLTDQTTGQVTVTAISCQPQWANTDPTSQIYTLQVAPPALSMPSGPGGTAIISTLTDASTSAVSMRYTTDGSQPTCSSGTLISGSSGTIGPLATGATVRAIGCKNGYAPSLVVTIAYGIELPPPFLASQNTLGSGLPGWDWAGTGQPVTSMTIPTGAAMPYGPFTVQQVGSPPCTGTGGAPEPASCTGPATPLADYFCWSHTTPARCDCFPFAYSIDPSHPSATLPDTANVNPGDTLSVVACQSAPPVNAPTTYAQPPPTLVSF